MHLRTAATWSVTLPHGGAEWAFDRQRLRHPVLSLMSLVDVLATSAINQDLLRRGDLIVLFLELRLLRKTFTRNTLEMIRHDGGSHVSWSGTTLRPVIAFLSHLAPRQSYRFSSLSYRSNFIFGVLTHAIERTRNEFKLARQNGSTTPKTSALLFSTHVTMICSRIRIHSIERIQENPAISVPFDQVVPSLQTLGW